MEHRDWFRVDIWLYLGLVWVLV